MDELGNLKAEVAALRTAVRALLADAAWRPGDKAVADLRATAAHEPALEALFAPTKANRSG